MGLDNYAVYPVNHPKWKDGDDLIPSELFPVQLCGGMFSDGQSGIRGKVYNEWCEYATGMSLYQEDISPEDVKELYARLLNANKLTFKEYCDEGDNYYALDWKDALSFREWVRVVAEQDGAIIGWW